MKGLPIGTPASVTNPVLQLFCRDGETLADFYAGTYQIDSIAGASVVPLVVATAFVPADRLGPGRYAIPTGDTSAWSVGTHRAICVYQQESGGPDVIEVVEFEMLSATDWVHSGQYIGYASSKALVDSGQFGTLGVETLHKAINKQSTRLERLLSRHFEPRYMTVKVDGEGQSILHLQEAAIAVEKVESAHKDATQGDVLVTYGAESYRVYNRHLDGDLSWDDRRDPKIELTGDLNYESSFIPPATSYIWPSGDLNIWITGVFGYTDPQPSLAVPGTGVGRTPEELSDVVMTLIVRELQDPTYTSLGIHYPGSITRQETRDQKAAYSGGATGAFAGITGDPLLDAVLMRFLPPPNLVYARR